MRNIFHDLSAANFAWGTRFKLVNLVIAVALSPGFRSVFFFRIQTSVLGKNTNVARRFAAFLISSLNQSLTGAEFIPGCLIGKGLVVKHPAGIVIGEGAIVGENCTFQHGTTLGLKYVAHADSNKPDGYPVVGNNVSFGTNAVVIGLIKIGDGAKIGANATIVKDVNAGQTAF